MQSQSMKITVILFLLIFWVLPTAAEDSDTSRATLAGLQGVSIIVEDLQPNVQKYAAKSGLSKMQVLKDTQKLLTDGGIRIVSGNDWLNIPGRPILYVSINTHETEKYWYAYDIQIQLRQMATLVANPQQKTLATTWSMNITGQANIGTLQAIRQDTGVMVGKFVQAYRMVNKK
jgi:hypothetical protein